MTTSVSVGSAHPLFVTLPAVFSAAAEISQGSTGENKKQSRHKHSVCPASGSGIQRRARGRWRKKRVGGENSVESPAAGSRSHTHGARQQTQFTKRHLFHYSNALWLITSWPVCEMRATYSPVNRKICTCSIWGVGEQGNGERGGRKGEQPGEEKRQGKT